MADALLGGIVINEVFVNPVGGGTSFDTDGNGSISAIDEYVELYNDASVAIDISGLELWDAGVGNWFTFPAGTILQPGAHAMVISGVQAGGSLPTGDPGDLFFDAGRGSAVINNGGDNLTVYDPGSDTYIQATFSGDAQDNPPTDYAGFSSTATQVGSGEDFGSAVNGESLQRFGDGNDSFVSGGPTAGVTNICFADGTLIATPTGPRPAEKIRAGDMVLTADHGAQPVQWVHSADWSLCEVMLDDRLKPIKIAPGALGNGMPHRTLRISQQHRMLVQGPIAQRMFGASDVLVPAKALLDLPGITLDQTPRAIRYIHIMCARHEVLFAEGAAAESLFLGEQALSSIAPDALAELSLVLRCDVAEIVGTAKAMRPARPFAKGKRARKLVARHIKNGRALVEA